MNVLNNNLNLSQSQLDNLMKLASQKMGTDPDKLKQQMQSGDMSALLGNLNSDQKAQINSLMNNPQAIQQFISNPKVQSLLKNLMGK